MSGRRTYGTSHQWAVPSAPRLLLRGRFFRRRLLCGGLRGGLCGSRLLRGGLLLVSDHVISPVAFSPSYTSHTARRLATGHEPAAFRVPRGERPIQRATGPRESMDGGASDPRRGAKRSRALTSPLSHERPPVRKRRCAPQLHRSRACHAPTVAVLLALSGGSRAVCFADSTFSLPIV